MRQCRESLAPPALLPLAASLPGPNRRASRPFRKARRPSLEFFLPFRRTWHPAGGRASSTRQTSKAAEIVHRVERFARQPKRSEESALYLFRSGGEPKGKDHSLHCLLAEFPIESPALP